MNAYELVVLYHPDLEIDLEKALKKVEKIVKDNKGKIVDRDNWGKRKLAYSINKQDHAIYVYYDIELPAEAVTKVEGTLNITDEVIRYLISVPGPEIEEDETESKSSTGKADDETAEKDDKKSAKETAKEDAPDEKEDKKDDTGSKSNTRKATSNDEE